VLVAGCAEVRHPARIDGKAAMDKSDASAYVLLSKFKHEEPWWSGKVPYRFWGGQSLNTYIVLENGPRPSDHQLRIFRSLVEQKDDVRPYFESSLFEQLSEERFPLHDSLVPRARFIWSGGNYAPVNDCSRDLAAYHGTKRFHLAPPLQVNWKVRSQFD
jgi:hypothetical protein